MIENYFEGINGLVKKGNIFVYLGKEIGQDVSEEYDLTSRYRGAIKFSVPQINAEVTIPLSKKEYLLIFSHSRGCINK